jgi:putative colanic acid biosynthesis acetyltransferase WcaF
MINTDTHTGPSFSLKNRLGRILWNITCVLFFRYSPKVFFGWRSLILRLFGGRIGKGVHIYPGVAIWAPWNLEVGDQCGIANGVILYSQGRISVGKKTVISQGAHICAGTHDYTHKGFKLITMPISIGDDVWIAADAFIHPGVIIGDGCVIGARAVVNKNMPAWMVCSGHPCKPIKKRIIDDNEK